MNLYGLLFMAAGIFALSGAGFNWDWFMNHRKARFWTNILGRTGVRIFYGLFGLGFTVLGFLMIIGMVNLN